MVDDESVVDTIVSVVDDDDVSDKLDATDVGDVVSGVDTTEINCDDVVDLVSGVLGQSEEGDMAG